MSRFEVPREGRLRAVGTARAEGGLLAVGIDVQPGRARAVVEATIEALGADGAVLVLGSWVRLAPDAGIRGPDGERLARDAIREGTRAQLAGRYTASGGFVADEVRVRRRREFEIEKVAGPATVHDDAVGRVEIAGIDVATSERTVFGSAESEGDCE